jgi:hypothetical protein
MKYANFIYSLVVTIVLGFLYNRYKRYEDSGDDEASYAIVEKFLINNSVSNDNNVCDSTENNIPLAKSKKPILWIHMKYDVNARWWASFYSRNSTDLNQPYLYLTIKSIIDACGKDFHICLIDDESFTKLMPDWNINVPLTAEPIKGKMRELGLAKLLCKFGGLLVPPSFICFQSLLPMYEYYTSKYSMFVGEMLNKTSTSLQILYFPNTTFMGCLKESSVMSEYITYLAKVISKDFVDESNFVGAYGRWCYEKSLTGEVGVISAENLGIKDAEGVAINIDRLIQNTFINLSGNVLGLYIPYDDIINRTAYNWFARLSARQVLEADTNISKYLLISR